jgi:threonine/homoserine/homoserine lactone efflux protein
MTAFLLTVLLSYTANVAIPGASFIVTVKTTLAEGSRSGYALALGLVSTDVVLAALAVSGLAVFLNSHQGALVFIGGLGGAWLASMGLRAIWKLQTGKDSPVQEFATSSYAKDQRSNALFLGFTTGLSNPQAPLFFVSVFATSAVNVRFDALDLVVVLVIFAGYSALLRSLIVCIATAKAFRRRYEQDRKRIELISGVALLLLGFKITVTSLSPWLYMLI